MADQPTIVGFLMPNPLYTRTSSICFGLVRFYGRSTIVGYLMPNPFHFDHLAWVEHQFLSDIRDSTKAGSLWGMMRGVVGVRKSIHQSWLAKGLGLGLLCWGFKGVQEEISSEEASTLQIGSVAFPPGQWSSPQLHPCHRLFDRDGHQDSSPASL